MLGLYLGAYIIFISLVALLLLALALRPKRGQNHIKGKAFNPRVLVIMPCKGHDIELKRNLEAAASQDYENYKLITVVDSNNDSALKSIRAANAESILSNSKCANCSGKVRAISTALSRFRDYDAYVILDSDALVGKDWLTDVITPLADRRIGISTSFPLFRPIGGFWSWVKFVWGFVGISLMESESTRFGWGGTLAFRKDLLSKDDMKYFSESVSDDIALTKIAKRKGLKLAYEPDAAPIIDSDDNLAKFSEWANRQTALSIRGDPKLFYYGVVFYSASILVLLSSIILSIMVSPVFLLLLLPLLAGALKTYKRSGGSLIAACIFPLINFLYLANLLKAKGMRAIEWRGRRYSLK